MNFIRWSVFNTEKFTELFDKLFLFGVTRYMRENLWKSQFWENRVLLLFRFLKHNSILRGWIFIIMIPLDNPIDLLNNARISDIKFTYYPVIIPTPFFIISFNMVYKCSMCTLSSLPFFNQYLKKLLRLIRKTYFEMVKKKLTKTYFLTSFSIL